MNVGWTAEQSSEALHLRQEGKQFAEIGNVVGRSAEAVRSHLRRRTEADRSELMEVLPRYRQKFDVTPAYLAGEPVTVLESRPDNTYMFGIAGDKHFGSKYHRGDVLDDLYRRFRGAGVDVVFDTGHWIEGEARFNKHDLGASGLDAQVRLMAKQHPKIDAPILAVWGDDHEGWYAQREGINVGKYAAGIMVEAGHTWVDLGFMESHVILRNINSGQEALVTIMHPGGGSAYALSYRPQKIVESLEGGEKPALIIMGHYHKLEALNVRNVWVLQAGCTQDQTPFMRKKSIEAHVGGVLLGLEQDPETGALIGFSPSIFRYFNRGYYNSRWSHHGPVNRPERLINYRSPKHRDEFRG